MHVDALMTRSPITASPDDSVRKLVDFFEKFGFHHLPVVENGHLLGIVSDRDVLRHVSPFVGMINERHQDSSTLDRRAHQVMSRRPITVEAGAAIGEAAALMLEHHISCLPVIDGEGRLLGIVTTRDLLRAAFPRIDTSA